VTIYRLYTENGNRAGFWIQHRSWSNICAQVQRIAGQSEGRLPDPPTDDCASVLMRVFDVRSGRPVPVPVAPAPEACQDRHYTRIAEPHWHHHRSNSLI
jgi:hypothetical protein